MDGPRVLLIGLVLGGLAGPAFRTSPLPKGVVIVPAVASEGVHGPPGEACSVRLSKSDMGGFLVLRVLAGAASDDAGELAEDVTGLAWADDETVVFTTSPIYGNPGLFLWRCGTDEPRSLVAGTHRSPAYPQGSDYFELVRLEIGDASRAVFLMTPDVETTDFGSLRKGLGHLFQVHLDGSDLRPYSPR